MVNDNSAPVSTKTDEPGVCPVSLRVIVPATGLSTVRVTQTLSSAQPCVAMDTTVGSLTAWTGPADNATAARRVAATNNVRRSRMFPPGFAPRGAATAALVPVGALWSPQPCQDVKR